MTEKEKLSNNLNASLARYGELEMSQDELTSILHEASEEIEDSKLVLWKPLLMTVDAITRYGYTSVPADEALEALLRALEV